MWGRVGGGGVLTVFTPYMTDGRTRDLLIAPPPTLNPLSVDITLHFYVNWFT